MDALSPTQIENILAERLKRHEDRLKEHRSSLENQKAWLNRQQNSSSSNNNSTANNNQNQNQNQQHHPMYDTNSSLQQQHQHNIDPRYEVAFSPNQVFPPSSHKVGFASSSNNNNNNNKNLMMNNQQQGLSSGDDSSYLNNNDNQLANNYHLSSSAENNSADLIPMMNFGSSSNNKHDNNKSSTTTPVATKQHQGNRRATTPPASKNLKEALRNTTNKNNNTRNNSSKQDNSSRVSMLESALDDRRKRTSMQQQQSSTNNNNKTTTSKSKLSSSFVPLNDHTDRDILGGDSLMDVVAYETTANHNHNHNNNINASSSSVCTFRPTISEDSRILAQKLRTACGAGSNSDVVESMEALHAKATKEKWMRLQAIHEEETKQFHNNNTSAATKQQQRAKTPTHNRLHETATKKIKEEKFRQMISESMQDSTFTPAITARAKSLKRHPGHNVGTDLYSLAVMKHQRDEEMQYMKDELEYVTSKRLGNPRIDAVSESIANSMPESSYERLTKPAHHRRSMSAGVSSNPNTHRNATNATTVGDGGPDGVNNIGGAEQEHTFHPEINRRSEMLARHHHQSHSLQSSPTKIQRRRDEKINALRKEIDQQRMEDCTFQPNTNNNSRRGSRSNSAAQQNNYIAGSSGYERSQEERTQEFYDRNERWLKKKETKISQLKTEKEKAELAEVTFAPNTNTSSTSFEDIDNQRGVHHPRQSRAVNSSNNNASYLNSIYGGNDHRAWGFDQHLDRMHAARIIDTDKRERAATGEPYHGNGGGGGRSSSSNNNNNSNAQQRLGSYQQQQHNQRSISERDDNRYAYPDENFDYYPPPSHHHQYQTAASRLQQKDGGGGGGGQYQQQYTYSNTNIPTNDYNNIGNVDSVVGRVGAGGQQSNHVRNSVLSRAEEALSRAMQVSTEQHQQLQAPPSSSLSNNNNNQDYDYSRRW